jgi:large conductance mechanosensitive channel
MALIKEFKTFAMRGNVVDLAVGIIIGGAFGKIVSSLVQDVIMPPIGLIVGGVDFTDLKLVIQQAQGDVAEVAIRYGMFIQQILDFVIVAFAIFMVIKGMNRLKRKEEAAAAAPPPAPPKPSAEAELLGEIRDLLKNRG